MASFLVDPFAEVRILGDVRIHALSLACSLGKYRKVITKQKEWKTYATQIMVAEKNYQLYNQLIQNT
jgi:hypothetical protein